MSKQLSTGQTYRARFKVDIDIIERFAELSGDRNPIHLDAEEAKVYGYPRQVAHGALLIAFLSRMIGMEIPGPGAIWMGQSAEWLKPVFVGDEIDFVITVQKISMAASVLELDIVAMNSKSEKVMQGEAKVKVAKRLLGETVSTADTDRVALITGGSRGIGAAIARRLAANGMTVVINYREAQREAEAVVEAIRSAGGSAQAIMVDLSDPTATTRMINEIINCFGRLDVVVHSASPAIHSAKVVELSYSELEPYLKVYLGAALRLVADASEAMAARKFGRFIFLGTASLFGIPPAGLAAYVAAKQALWGFMKCAATELGPKGITTNMVSPGMTVTDLTINIPARVKEVEARRNPMRRLATVRDTAELVAFLASDASGYINGANLPITGGAT
jgi:3-oxoacyl-[acyl-carrier protein] reductase